MDPSVWCVTVSIASILRFLFFPSWWIVTSSFFPLCDSLLEARLREVILTRVDDSQSTREIRKILEGWWRCSSSLDGSREASCPPAQRPSYMGANWGRSEEQTVKTRPKRENTMLLLRQKFLSMGSAFLLPVNMSTRRIGYRKCTVKNVNCIKCVKEF